MFCGPLLILLNFFFSPLYCLSFNLRLLVYPLTSSTFHCIVNNNSILNKTLPSCTSTPKSSVLAVPVQYDDVDVDRASESPRTLTLMPLIIPLYYGYRAWMIIYVSIYLIYSRNGRNSLFNYILNQLTFTKTCVLLCFDVSFYYLVNLFVLFKFELITYKRC